MNNPSSSSDAFKGAPLSPHERRRLAVAAAVHPVTLQRYLGGQAIRSTCRSRIEEALATSGLGALVRVRPRGT